MYCTQCGKRLDDRAEFCVFCGHKVLSAKEFDALQTRKPAQTQNKRKFQIIRH